MIFHPLLYNNKLLWLLNLHLEYAVDPWLNLHWSRWHSATTFRGLIRIVQMLTLSQSPELSRYFGPMALNQRIYVEVVPCCCVPRLLNKIVDKAIRQPSEFCPALHGE